MSQKTVFLTGCSGGLGSRTTGYLVEKGWHVFAADFNREAMTKMDGEIGISTLFIDVTDQASIDIALKVVLEQVEGLDGIVNFAGIFAAGSLIEINEDTLFHVFNVNVMGTYRVNKTFFPLVQKRKGRIVNLSSETGWQSAGPFNGPYAMSKHAIEAYSDSLRRELMFLDIPVIKIQPGPFQSNMIEDLEVNFSEAQSESTYFKDVLSRLKVLVNGEMKKANDPVIVAQAIHKALTVSNPKPAYSVMPDRKRVFMEWLPNGVQDRLLKKVLRG